MKANNWTEDYKDTKNCANENGDCSVSYTRYFYSCILLILDVLTVRCSYSLICLLSDAPTTRYSCFYKAILLLLLFQCPLYCTDRHYCCSILVLLDTSIVQYYYCTLFPLLDTPSPRN